jgi:hypothetical protein
MRISSPAPDVGDAALLEAFQEHLVKFAIECVSFLTAPYGPNSAP